VGLIKFHQILAVEMQTAITDVQSGIVAFIFFGTAPTSLTLETGSSYRKIIKKIPYDYINHRNILSINY